MYFPGAEVYSTTDIEKFDAKTIDAWFTILEAQFEVAEVTSGPMKFKRTLASLPPSTVKHLSKEVLESNDFGALRVEVTRLHEYKKLELFDRLITEASPAGRPSNVLAMIREVADRVDVDEEQVRRRFYTTLPEDVAAICSSQQAYSLDEIGQLADRLVLPVDNFRDFPNGKPSPSSSSADEVEEVRKGLTPFYPAQKPKVCRGHIFFGVKAHYCLAWCQWPDKDGVKILSRCTSSEQDFVEE